MMISPEAYYEVALKDKTQPELLEEIQSLKEEIAQLKQYIEEHPYEPEEMFPTRRTRLKCKREYLDQAVKAYEEAGGQYIPTEAEQKSRSFDAALDSIKKLVFSIGGYFQGHEIITYTVTDDKVLLDVKHIPLRKPIDLPVYDTFDKEEFINGLKKIHIGEWKRDYMELGVMDGTQWELKIYFEDREPVEISGCNAYPYNFDDLMELLGIEWESEEEDMEELEDEEDLD